LRVLRLHSIAIRARSVCALILLLAGASVLISACEQRQDLKDGYSVFPLPGGHGRTCSITSGPDGNRWFTYIDKGQIARMTPKGALTVFSLPNLHAGPCSLKTGPDGAIWFTESYDSKIGRITTDGQVTEFSGLSDNASSITVGPDGNLWFVKYLGDRIGKITTAGQITEFPVAIVARPGNITSGPDGDL
jgi:virginiamycin B lyase